MLFYLIKNLVSIDKIEDYEGINLIICAKKYFLKNFEKSVAIF